MNIMKRIETAPGPIMENPAFKAASDGVIEMRAKGDAAGVQLRAVEARIARLFEPDDGSQIEDRAVALARGEISPPRDDLETLRAQANTLRLDQADYRRALAIRRNSLAEIKAHLSAPASAQMQPAHRAAVRKILAGIEMIQVGLKEEEAVRHALTEAGYDCHLTPPEFPFQLSIDANWDFARAVQKLRGYVG